MTEASTPPNPIPSLKCIAWCPDDCDESAAREYVGRTPRGVAEQHAQYVFAHGMQRECYEVRVRAAKGDRVREWDVTVDVDIEMSFSAVLAFPRFKKGELAAEAAEAAARAQDLAASLLTPSPGKDQLTEFLGPRREDDGPEAPAAKALRQWESCFRARVRRLESFLSKVPEDNVPTPRGEGDTEAPVSPNMGGQTAMRSEHRVKVGEYEFVRPVPNYGQCLDIFDACMAISTVSSDRNDAIGLMMEHLDAARALVQAAREIVDAPTLRRKEFLQEALALYDSLVSDHRAVKE